MTFEDNRYNKNCIHHTMGFLDDKRCPYCGAPNRKTLSKRIDAILFIIMLVAFAIVIGALVRM